MYLRDIPDPRALHKSHTISWELVGFDLVFVFFIQVLRLESRLLRVFPVPEHQHLGFRLLTAYRVPQYSNSLQSWLLKPGNAPKITGEPLDRYTTQLGRPAQVDHS